MRGFLLLFIFTVFLFNHAASQDVSFTQLLNTKAFTHPSLCNNRNAFEVQLHHRDQWTSAGRGYNDYFLRTTLQIDRFNFAGHLLYENNGVGRYKTMQESFAVTWSIVYSKKFQWNIASSAQLITKEIDWSKLVFSDQLDLISGISTAQSFTPETPKRRAYDLSFGTSVWMKSKGFFAESEFAFTWHHAVKANESIIGDNINLPDRFIAYAHTAFSNPELMEMSVQYESQAAFIERTEPEGYAHISKLQAGLYSYTTTNKKFRVGVLANIRTNPGVWWLAGESTFVIGEKSRLGISHDFAFGGIDNRRVWGAWEVTYIYATGKPMSLGRLMHSGKKSFRNSCPKNF